MAVAVAVAVADAEELAVSDLIGTMDASGTIVGSVTVLISGPTIEPPISTELNALDALDAVTVVSCSIEGPYPKQSRNGILGKYELILEIAGNMEKLFAPVLIR